ncbi:hypothetical protein E3P94_03037 [Wallemia ichthyophaga]|nr:hypothetical protein E3P95_03077 [Wallemia ichthyophaga]TIA98218.1 hypothetical protein E3P94_03037 [Wallemia ichthyophaga]
MTSPLTFYPEIPTLKSTDNLRISFLLDGEHFNLHLHPNEDLFHPHARVNYLNKSGHVHHSELLQKENFRVYHGYTVSSEHSDRRVAEDAARIIRNYDLGNIFTQDDIIRGRANIMIHDDGVDSGSSPQFEGSFTFDSELYHIKTPSSYLASKGDDDPSPSYHPSRLIIFKESDTVERTNTTLTATCGTDSTHYPSLEPIEPLTPFTMVEEQPSWTLSLKKWLDVLFGTETAKPYVRFAPIDDHTLDRAITQARDRHSKRAKRQGTGDVSGGNDEPASSYVDTIGSTEGCPTEQRLLYMGFAADCTYVENYDNAEKARTQILQDVNQISGLYKDSFKISLGVVELNVQEPECPDTRNDTVPWNQACGGDVELNDRLSLFSAWRGQKGDDGIGLWHLMTKCNTGSKVGVAWLGTLCQQDVRSQSSQSVSGTAVTTITRNQWAVAAHEIGHNFGAIHDCDDGCSFQQSCCPLSSDTCDANNNYIMSATSSDSATEFSDCSIGNICSALGSGQTSTSCLLDPSSADREIKSLKQCGNGILEDDEECDGGGETNCCTDQCKFKNGAVCDFSTDGCCNDNCQFASSSQVCRPSIDDKCDMEEKCTGDSGKCPDDKYKENGKDCGDAASLVDAVAVEDLDIWQQHHFQPNGEGTNYSREDHREWVVVGVDTIITHHLRIHLLVGMGTGRHHTTHHLLDTVGDHTIRHHQHRHHSSHRCKKMYLITGECITETKDRGGVSRPTIKKFLSDNYSIDPESKLTSHHISQSLKRGIDNKVFVTPNGITGKVKLAPAGVRKRPVSDSEESDDDKVPVKTKREKAPTRSRTHTSTQVPKKVVTGKTASGRNIVSTNHSNDVNRVQNKKTKSATTRKLAAKKDPAGANKVPAANKAAATKKVAGANKVAAAIKSNTSNKPARKSDANKPTPIKANSTTNRRKSTRKVSFELVYGGRIN